jgi:hypothetical protein
LAAQVITIERKKYAVGLFWQPLPLGQNPRDFAKVLSKQIPGNSKLYASFKSMVAVGGSSMGHRRRMEVAAAEVMNSFAEHSAFLAAFFVPQGFWIVAVRNNIIIFDQLFASEADAKREFITLSELPDWSIVIAPSYWNIPRAVEKPLRDIVSGASKITLSSIGGGIGNFFALLIGLGLLFGLWYLFQDSIMQMIAPRPQQAKINPEIVAAYQNQLDAKSAPAVQTGAENVFAPYENLPDINLRAQQCWRGVAYVMQQIPGWVQVSAECDGMVARARLGRTYGTLAGLHESVGEIMEDVFIAEGRGSDAMIEVGLAPLPPADSNVLQNLKEDVIFSVNSLFQMIGVAVEVSALVETIGPNESVSVVMVRCASKLKPDEFVKIFDGFEPLYLQSAKWDARSRVWNYEVKIYAR